MKSRRARGRYAYANYDPTIICAQGGPKFRADRISRSRVYARHGKRIKGRGMDKGEEIERAA